MSVLDAAVELSESRTKILARCANHELESQKVAGRTVITRESVRRLKEEKAASAAA